MGFQPPGSDTLGTQNFATNALFAISAAVNRMSERLYNHGFGLRLTDSVNHCSNPCRAPDQIRTALNGWRIALALNQGVTKVRGSLKWKTTLRRPTV